jgi:hypothetical protein
MAAQQKLQPRRTVLIYGKTKCGKTLDVAWTFGENGYWLNYEPDGLASVESNLGFVPPYHELVSLTNPYGETLEHLTKVVLPQVKQGKIKCVIMDTGSEFADRLLSVELGVVGQDARRTYPLVYQKFATIMRTALQSGAWFVMICHQKLADQENDRMGGPLLPGRLVESVPSQFSLILRAAIKDTPKGRERVYFCDPEDPYFLMGDRYGAAYIEQPMELKPIMWRVANPDGITPDELLKGKPIRLGGKLYQPGTLPKKIIDPLAGLDGDGAAGTGAKIEEPAKAVEVKSADELLA